MFHIVIKIFKLAQNEEPSFICCKLADPPMLSFTLYRLFSSDLWTLPYTDLVDTITLTIQYACNPSLCPCSDSSMDGEPSWSPVRDHTTLPGRAWRNDVKKIERVVFDLKRSGLVRAAFNLFLCPVYPAENMRSLRPLSLGSYRHFFSPNPPSPLLPVSFSIFSFHLPQLACLSGP